MEAQKYCQSCGMPLMNENEIGTNADGSKSSLYCVYCFKDGNFTLDCSMNEMIDMSVKHMKENGILASQNMTEEEATAQMKEFYPELKRWKCTCTDDCASGYNPECTCTSSECHCREKK
jgi:hypothetical protein